MYEVHRPCPRPARLGRVVRVHHRGEVDTGLLALAIDRERDVIRRMPGCGGRARMTKSGSAGGELIPPCRSTTIRAGLNASIPMVASSSGALLGPALLRSETSKTVAPPGRRETVCRSTTHRGSRASSSPPSFVLSRVEKVRN